LPKSDQRRNGWLSDAALKAGDKRSIHIRTVGEFFLRDILLRAMPS